METTETEEERKERLFDEAIANTPHSVFEKWTAEVKAEIEERKAARELRRQERKR